MQIVMINGGPGIGKTRFGRELAKLLGEKYALHARAERHIDILRDMLFEFAERHDGIHTARTEENYVELKNRIFYKGTGRQWQIAWGQGMRSVNTHVFSADLTRRIEIQRMATGQELFIVDDFGFPDEWNFMMNAYGEKNITGIYLEQRLNHRYIHGEQFKDDSRICCSGFCDMIDVSIEVAAQAIVDRLSAYKAS